MKRFFKASGTRAECKKGNGRAHVRLQTILVVLVALIVVCSVSVTAFCCYLTFRSILLDRVAASRNDVLMQMSAKVDSLQASMVSMSRLYSNMVTDFTRDEIYAFSKGNDTDKKTTLAEVMEAYQDAVDVKYSVTILGEGNFSCVFQGKDGAYDLSEIQKELWYLNIPTDLEPNEVFWTQSHKDPTLGDGFYFSAVRKVPDHEGNKVTVLLSISERFFYEAYRNVVSNNCIYLVNKKGRVLSSSTESLVSLNYFNMDRLDDLVASENYTIVEKSGVKYLLSRYDNPKYDVIYLEEIPLNSLLSSLGYIQKRSAVVAVVAILFACTVCWVMIHTLTSPLLILCQKLERVSEGQFDTQFDVKSWQEISLINDACYEMEKKISDLFTNLREEEKQKRLAEIEFLQAQINPHFMYNTLFEIKCLVNLGDNCDAERMLENFIAMLRTVLSYKDEMITLQEELVILQQYFVVMQCKYGDGILLVYDIPEELLQRKILKFVLQPIVENSIFHGLEPVGSRGRIVVTVREEGKYLYIQVEDDGAGMEEAQLEEICCEIKAAGEGSAGEDTVGICNVIRRIKLHFGAEYGAKISSRKNIGTKVRLILPNEVK